MFLMSYLKNCFRESRNGMEDGINISSLQHVLLFFKLLANNNLATSDVLEHKWRASLRTILFIYE